MFIVHMLHETLMTQKAKQKLSSMSLQGWRKLHIYLYGL